jgi:hypothetical protein
MVADVEIHSSEKTFKNKVPGFVPSLRCMGKLRRYDYEFLTVAIDGAEWLASLPVPFIPKK